VLLAAAIGAFRASPAAAQQLASEALFDPDLTVGAGATISATIGALVAHAEDKAIPDRLFDEPGAPRRTANVTYRFLKHVFFDAPQEELLLVFNHEVFGHGGRLRERFHGPTEYHIEVPAPYGGGAGATLFVLDREPTPYELLAISAGGMESTSVVASIVAERAFADGRMQPRDALRYLIFEFDTQGYIASTDAEGDEPGHDVGDFLRTYNELAASARAPGLTTRQLRRESLAGLANPVGAYALFGIARYWWNGNTDIGVPTLSIAGVRYLPLVRYRLTPYGTEWALVNALGGRVRPMEVELRIGRSPLETPWGIGVHQRSVARWSGWTVDAAVDVWRQPPVAGTDPRRVEFDLRTGTRVRGRVHREVMPVWFSTSRASLIVEVGAKSAGYVPGEPLRGGIVARAGIGLPLP
jgi:hypothetical protein